MCLYHKIRVLKYLFQNSYAVRTGLEPVTPCVTGMYSKNILHLHQLYAFVAETNNASIHLFEKMGYSVGGVLHDWLYDGNRFQNALLVQTFL